MATNAAGALSRLTLNDLGSERARPDTSDTMYTTYTTAGRTVERFGRIFATPLYEAEYFLNVDEEEMDRLLIAH